MKLNIFFVLMLFFCMLLTSCVSVKRGNMDYGEDSSISEKTIQTQAYSKTDATTSKSSTHMSSTSVSTKEVILPTSNVKQFDNSKNGIYNYCPSIMQMSDGTMYIYYCTNQKSNNVTDYVGCRKGLRQDDGGIIWGTEKIVLSPSAGGWDAVHTCDPSVIAGNFRYNNEYYGYLMAYLGCTSTDNQENKIGLAVAKSPEGPFVKVGNTPFIDFTKESNVTVFQWGVGQPSLVNMDKDNRIAVFYTRGDKNGTRVMVEEWDLENLNSPAMLTSSKLSATGLKNLNGGSDYMNNADFVYDSVKDRFYASSDCHPNPSSEPNFISSHFRVTYFDRTANWGGITNRTLAVVGKNETGSERNHNTGILRDEYGRLPNNGYITVFYTISITGPSSLWSYRIYNYNIKLP